MSVVADDNAFELGRSRSINIELHWSPSQRDKRGDPGHPEALSDELRGHKARSPYDNQLHCIFQD